MAKTRSAKSNAANLPKVEPLDNDDVPIEKEELDAQVATHPIVPVAFKATLDRFRHNDTENHTLEAKGPQSYKDGRKRPLNSVIKHEEAHSTIASPSPAKRRRQPSKYAPPSTYSHLPTLVDVLEPNLICVFVGTNPGIRTATTGHAYAHPSNMFWKLLHSSGCTDERLKPEQDVDLPRLYSMGNTNIVERPSRDAAELSKAEMTEGTPILEEKVRKYRPEAICVVGKGIFEAIWRWRYGKQIKKDQFHYGWQDEIERMGKCDDWEGARIFVSSSTSGLSASTKPHEKEAIWKPFGEWVQARRKERAAEVDGLVKQEAVDEDLLKEKIVKEKPVL
jgi:mismatch-specific thymine-DNA glycosylase